MPRAAKEPSNPPPSFTPIERKRNTKQAGKKKKAKKAKPEVPEHLLCVSSPHVVSLLGDLTTISSVGLSVLHSANFEEQFRPPRYHPLRGLVGLMPHLLATFLSLT